MTISIALPPNLRPIIASITNISKYPPSNTGNGNRLIIAKLTESRAIIDSNAKNPAAIAFPDTWAIVMNEPNCFVERSPVTICFNTVNKVFDW